MKVEAKKSGCISPMPKVVVTVRDKNGRNNALVVGYCANCSFNPPMVIIGIVPSRFSYHMIKENGSFVAHLLSENQTDLYSICGTKSGRDGDKLESIDLRDADKVNAAIIEACPVAIECTVVDSIVTGSHELFVGKIECVHAEESAVDEKGVIAFEKLHLLT